MQDETPSTIPVAQSAHEPSAAQKPNGATAALRASKATRRKMWWEVACFAYTFFFPLVLAMVPVAIETGAMGIAVAFFGLTSIAAAVVPLVLVAGIVAAYPYALRHSPDYIVPRPPTAVSNTPTHSPPCAVSLRRSLLHTFEAAARKTVRIARTSVQIVAHSFKKTQQP